MLTEASPANDIKVLLLGTSTAGKTTLCKQLKIIYDGGFSDKESQLYGDGIACSVFSYTCSAFNFDEKETKKNKNVDNRDNGA